MKALSDKLLAAFDSEHREILTCIRSHLIDFEQDRGAMTAAALDEVFRMAHTLKGAARVVDLAEVVTLAHRLEALFTQVREGKLPLEAGSLRVIRGALDAIEDLVASSRGGGANTPTSAKALLEIDGLLGQPLKLARVPEPPAEESLPIHAQALGAKAPGTQLVVDAKAPGTETLRVDAGHLDSLLRMTGELLTSLQGDERFADDLRAIEGRALGIQKEWDTLRKIVLGPLRRLAEASEVRRVESSLESVEQDLRALSKRVRKARHEGRQAAWRQGLFGEQLRQELKNARMVAAGEVLDGFHKMVRDLAADAGKQVEFRAFGLENEADRRVLQELKSPLMHMLRNCVSHGLETAPERALRGKQPAGSIALKIETSGGFLRISLEDDGRGLDLGKIGETAVKRGLITADALRRTGDEEVARFILAPAFSTAPEITDVAGRGMGLSVAHEAVKKLQGALLIEAPVGGGTRFVVTVPLSISGHRILLVAVQGRGFGIPLHGVDRLLSVKPADIKSIDGFPCVLLADKPIRIQELSMLLGIVQAQPQPPDATASRQVVVLKSGDKRLAVSVDAIVSEVEALIQDLGRPLAGCRHLLGGVLLGDGSVSIVLEPGGLMLGKLGSSVATPAPLPATVPGKAARPARILVVDDSITTRTLEKTILEAHGYEVGLAVDGAEALAKLKLQSFDLIISDVEMPLMDGFALLAELKKNPRLAKTPVIMVTSRENPSDQERGLNLGADAYILKQKFDQGLLLEAIRRHL